MLGNINFYYDSAIKAIDNNAGNLNWLTLKESSSSLWNALSQMKFEDFSRSEQHIFSIYSDRYRQIDDFFRRIVEYIFR